MTWVGPDLHTERKQKTSEGAMRKGRGCTVRELEIVPVLAPTFRVSSIWLTLNVYVLK
jgi:hypothetical protein